MISLGRRGGRASDKTGARDMAMDAVGTAWEKQYKAAVEEWESTGKKGPKPDPESFGKDEYRDEEFEEGELLRGKQDDRDASKISQHGRWGSRATDKAGARDGYYATDPPVSEAQRSAMWAAKSGNSTLGIPQSVGAEFAKADPGGSLPSKAR